MKFAAGNAQHIGARPQQQDAFGFSDPSDHSFVVHGGFLGVVADGMGGLANGSEASHGAVRAFLQAYTSKSQDESIPEALTRSLREANDAVLRLAAASTADELGTTLVAAALHDGVLHWISAGDSRIYLLRGNNLIQLTVDHTYARELNAKAADGKISVTEAQSHPERAALTSYLGQPEPKEVDRNQRPLAVDPEDSVILCSDGLYRALSEEEIVATFHDDLQHSCARLVAQVLAKQRKQQDNMTIIALKDTSTSKTASNGHGGMRAAAVLMVGVIVASLSAGSGYWYDRHFIGKETATQTQNSSQGAADTSKGVDTAEPVNPKKSDQQTPPNDKLEVPQNSPKLNPDVKPKQPIKPKEDSTHPPVNKPTTTPGGGEIAPPSDQTPAAQKDSPSPQPGATDQTTSPAPGGNPPDKADDHDKLDDHDKDQQDKKDQKDTPPPPTSPDPTKPDTKPNGPLSLILRVRIGHACILSHSGSEG